MNEDDLTRRREELFAPIQKQILMTDDENDLLLLATNMFTTSMHIFCQQYGLAAGIDLMQVLINQYKDYNTD
jgi:hypothetical protein